jgi:hypothetical protein
MEQRANKMTTRNVETDQAGEYTTAPAEAVPEAPSILIAEEQPAIQDLLCWTLQLAGYHPIMCAGRQASLTWPGKAMAERDIPMVLLLDLSFVTYLPIEWGGFYAVSRVGRVPPESCW